MPRVQTLPICMFFLVFVSLLESTAATGPSDTSDYMPAIRQELARLDIPVSCDEATSSCIYKKSLGDKGPSFDIVLHYSRQTDTIYMYIDKFIVPKDGALSCELSHRLLELNREMVTAKFEWDKGSGSVRLSAVINTDSNLDRRALRSQLVGLWSVAKKVWPTLSALTGDSR